MVFWQKFNAAEWNIEYDERKLASHGVAAWEAEEVLFNGFVVRPNKKKYGDRRFQLLGRTESGKPLLLIVHVRGDRHMRVLNGWPI